MMPPQGGLKTDGQQVDPVSGNKVPVGSNANEVRDDIPAQLSDGEYVVPADIVRYYGVKFFEDLRNQGKGGLKDMAANGRIGGDPVPPGGPQATGFSPEETQAMQSMVGAAMGGMMTQQMPPADPYAQQANMYQQRQGYDGGGFGSRSFATTPTRYSGAFSWETPDPEPTGDGTGDGNGDTGGDQTPVTLYCPDGRVNTLQLPADQDMYDQLITEGCGIDQSILPSSGEGGPEVPEVTDEQRAAWMDDFGYKGDGTENFEDIVAGTEAALDPDNRNFIEKLLSGGAIGKLQQATTAAQVAANIAILEANAQTPEEFAEVERLRSLWNNYVKTNNLDLLPKEFINGDQLAKQINSTQVDWSLGRDSKDVNGNPIFKSDEDFYKQIEEVASDEDSGTTATYIRPGETYTDSITGEQTTAPETGVIVYDYENDVGTTLGGELLEVTDDGVKVFKPGEDTIRPPSRPDGPTTGVIEDTNVAQVDEGGPTTVDPTQNVPTSSEASADPNLAKDIQDDLAATQAIFEQPLGGTGTDDPTITETVDLTSPEETTTYTYEDPGDSVDTPVYSGSSRDDDDDYSIPTVATGTQAYGGSQAAETALIQSDLSDDDFWDEFESGTSGGGSSGGGSSGGGSSSTTTNTASSGRTESQIQADINQALQDSGGAWTSELNDLVSERDSARSNEGGGSSGGGGGGGGGGSSGGGSSGGGGGGCCFIMLEARYGNGTMDEVVRRYRDEYMTDRNRRGYYRMAEVLVPLMRKSKTFKWIITKTFADPLVSYGKYYYGQNKHGVIYSPLKNFWMKVFDVVGGDTKFIRENGEVV
jgi:hypothetical protein